MPGRSGAEARGRCLRLRSDDRQAGKRLFHEPIRTAPSPSHPGSCETTCARRRQPRHAPQRFGHGEDPLFLVPHGCARAGHPDLSGLALLALTDGRPLLAISWCGDRGRNLWFQDHRCDKYVTVCQRRQLWRGAWVAQRQAADAPQRTVMHDPISYAAAAACSTKAGTGAAGCRRCLFVRCCHHHHRRHRRRSRCSPGCRRARPCRSSAPA